jgi:hypothetical protein
MAVLSFREVLPRTFQQRLGESPTAERKFVVTLDEPTGTQAIINAVGIGIGSSHPEFAYLTMTEASVSETDRQHAEVTYRYELLQPDQNDPNPLLRPDVWNFSVGGASVPALFFYPDDGNVAEPLVNAAGDIFENLMTEEAEVRATVSGNRAQFPLSLAAFVTNAVNNSAYLGGQPYTWKCAGISGQQATEIVNNQEVRYYQITSELVYRASGWQLILADVGFNFKDLDGNIQRCFVVMRDADGNEIQVPTANAVPLAANGQMLAAGELPRLLVRRVHRATNFNQWFGTPGF